MYLAIACFSCYLHKVTTGEHEADIPLDVGQQLLQSGVGLKMVLDGLAHHGVLAHEDDGAPAQRHTDLLHLGRAHVVRTHKETFWVVVQQLLSTNNIM